MEKEAGEQGRMRRRGRAKGRKESIKCMDTVLTKQTKAEGISWKRECKMQGQEEGMECCGALSFRHDIA